ncbi:MAG: DUF502 domain-containing protein [Methylobacter sp.]|jgi:uncharacterized membrane protein|uniref:DUF502 domain-containing protein n=1 Tax=Methylobacter sp. TaxID=2051955 RepID=UPI0025EAA8DA|nr:DUF502 domain-containing protein [Methylobacter sp.]MCK9619206.1 DUF502 domain-containing protein [Methylobacter sp.]
MSNYNNWQYHQKPVNRTFLKGLFALIPITLTVYLLFWMAATAEFALGKIFKFFFPDSWYIAGMGFVLGLVVTFFFGSFLESQTFRRLFHIFEELVMQIPFVKGIYTTIRDFSSLFSSEKKGKFQQVVLVKGLPDNCQQIGFITASKLEEASPAFIADDRIAVFLPFSYQLGGYTVIMPRENVVEIDMSVEDALRFIATAGVVGDGNDQKK